MKARDRIIPNSATACGRPSRYRVGPNFIRGKSIRTGHHVAWLHHMNMMPCTRFTHEWIYVPRNVPWTFYSAHEQVKLNPTTRVCVGHAGSWRDLRNVCTIATAPILRQRHNAEHKTLCSREEAAT